MNHRPFSSVSEGSHITYRSKSPDKVPDLPRQSEQQGLVLGTTVGERVPIFRGDDAKGAVTFLFDL